MKKAGERDANNCLCEAIYDREKHRVDEAVAKIRSELVDLLKEQGGVHLQVAKSYRYPEKLRPESWSLLKTIKQELDPKGRINPGNLGL